MLRSLLLTRDDAIVRIVGRVYKDLEVGFEHCSEAGLFLPMLVKHRYDAVVLDDSIEEAAFLLQRLIELPECSKAVRIVLAEPVGTINAVFKSGTQVILYKPLSLERARHGLRAVRNLMGRDRRRATTRIPTMLQARIRHGRAGGGQVFIADLSESGAAIQCGSDHLPSKGTLHMDFAIPGDQERIHVTAELIWQGNKGSAGVRFLDIPSQARRRLAGWIKQQSAKTAKDGVAAAAHAGRTF